MVALYGLMELLPKDFNPSFTGRHRDLYVFLKKRKHKFSKEERATISFLGKGGDTQRKYFNRIKNKLKQELAKEISKNQNSLETSNGLHYESCYTEFTAYNMLLLNGKRNAATEMAKSLIKKLQKTELHSLIYTIARDLNLYYSSINIHSHSAKYYGKIAKEQLRLINAEAIVREHHNEVAAIINSRENYTPSMIAVFHKAAKDTTPFLKLGSHAINRFIYNIVVSQYMADFNYEKVLEYSIEAYNSFPSTHPNYKIMYFGFLQMKLPALMALGRFQEAKEIARESCQMVSPGGFNWHLAHNRRCLICLHLGQYQEAYDLYKEQAKYKCPFPNLSEYWGIIWGYLYFLIKTGNIQEYTDERFYLGRFLNEVPIYSKDKAGNNINILILQIITRLYKKQYGYIIDRIEALGNYTRIYTRKPETLRANLFINMLLKIDSAGYHRLAVERKTQKLFDKLKTTPLRLRQSLAVEIIPYEILWHEILTLLEDKFQAKTINKAKIQE